MQSAGLFTAVKRVKGYNLPAKYVIHTVGPVYRGGAHGEAEKLESCYLRSLEEAERLGIRSIAFPAISTGVYGYPKVEAAEIAVKTVQNYLKTHSGSGIEEVLMVCFDARTEEIYRELL